MELRVHWFELVHRRDFFERCTGEVAEGQERTVRAIRHGAELIFCDDDGSLLRPGQFHEVLWAAQKRAGLRRIKWHDLRHSYASILASGGMPLFLIRGLLGHSSIAMTERYAHLAASQTAAYMPLLSAAGPSKPTPPPPPSGPQVGPSTLASRN